MIFKKYEFDDRDDWELVRDTLYTDGELIPEVEAIHEIGHICFAYDEEGECTDLSTYYAIDMLLNDELPSLDEYEVFPDPDGVHIFAGCGELYRKRFCQINPTSPYCQDEDLFE